MVFESLGRPLPTVNVHGVEEGVAIGGWRAAADVGSEAARGHRTAQGVEGGREGLGDGLGCAAWLRGIDEEHEEAVGVRHW